MRWGGRITACIIWGQACQGNSRGGNYLNICSSGKATVELRKAEHLARLCVIHFKRMDVPRVYVVKPFKKFQDAICVSMFQPLLAAMDLYRTPCQSRRSSLLISMPEQDPCVVLGESRRISNSYSHSSTALSKVVRGKVCQPPRQSCNRLA